MNKQKITTSSTANLVKNTLQELWVIKDETAANFTSVSAYFEHLRNSQKLRTKPEKKMPFGDPKQKAAMNRRTAQVH
jgi:hypothetical protein